MSNRNFNRKQCLEKEIKDLYGSVVYNALIQASATLDLTNDIILTKVSGGAANNTKTFKVVVNVAAANPSNTILAAFTGTSSAIICTITPNDGTNNTATPVNLTTAELRELISTGVVAGKTVTITDLSSLRVLQTATGGGAANLVNSGEGDNVIATFAGGQNQSFFNLSKWGISSIAQTGTGAFRITLEDKYNSLKFINVIVKSTNAKNLVFQIAGEDVNGSIPYIDLIAHANGSVANPANGDILLIGIEVKNTSIA